MSNKFTKSVLERQAKESKQVQSIPKETEQEKKQVMAKKNAIKQPPAKQIDHSDTAINLDAFIIKENTRNAKNKTFYLDTAVIDAIHRAAKSKNINDSKLVNDILKKILQID